MEENDDITEESRKLIESVKEILEDRSEEDIHEMLVRCNMNVGDTIDGLLSEDPFQEVKSKRNKKKETKDKSVKGGVDRSIRNPEFGKGGGGNKSNIYEATNVQGTRNHLAGSLTTSYPSNSHLTNGESKRLPMKNDISAESRKCIESVKGILSDRSEKEIHAMLVQCNMNVGDTIIRLLSEGEAVSSSSATSPILSDQPPSNSELTNNETKRVPISSGKAPVKDNSGSEVNQNLRSEDVTSKPPCFAFGTFGSERNASDQLSSLPSNSKIADDLPLKGLSLRDDQTVPAQENQYKSLSPFGNNLWLIHGLDPTESSRQRAVTMPKEYSLFDSSTASSVGSMPSTLRIEALETASSLVPKKNQLAMNHHNSQPQVPSGLRLTQSYNNSPYGRRGLPQSGMLASPVVTYTPVRMSTEGSAYGVGSSGNNTEMLPSFQHQDGNSNMWPSPYQRINGAAQAYHHSTGQQNPSPVFGHEYDHISSERRSTYYEYLNQRNARARRDASDDPNQTQQHQGRRNS